METPNTVTCKNCGNIFTGNFCNICGQKVINSRFLFKQILIDFFEATFNLDKGFFFTLILLLTNPKKVINEYLSGRTKRYFNPIKYLIIIAGLSALIVIATKSFDKNLDVVNSISSDEISSVGLKIINFMKSYINIIMLMLVPFFAFSFKLFFLRTKLNYTEHLIINCYAFGTGILIINIPSLIFAFINGVSHLQTVIGFIIQITVYAYFYHKLANRKLIIDILAAITAFFLGMIFMTLAYILLMQLIILILVNLSLL